MMPLLQMADEPPYAHSCDIRSQLCPIVDFLNENIVDDAIRCRDREWDMTYSCHSMEFI